MRYLRRGEGENLRAGCRERLLSLLRGNSVGELMPGLGKEEEGLSDTFPPPASAAEKEKVAVKA